MAKKTEQTFTKDDFLPTKKVAAEYKITFDQALAVMQHMYKNNMTVSFTSGQSTVHRPAVTRVYGTGMKILKLHPMANNLFRAEYERMEKAGKLPPKPKRYAKAKEVIVLSQQEKINATRDKNRIEKARAVIAKIKQAKGKGNEI